jgi:hypothetical protein
MSTTTASAVDLDRYQRVVTSDGLVIEGTRRIGWHLLKNGVEVAHFFDSEIDAVQALDRYQKLRREADRVKGCE